MTDDTPQRPDPDDVRLAALHMLEIAACYDLGDPDAVEGDRDSLALLGACVARLLAHRNRRAYGFAEAASLVLVNEVAQIYVKIQHGLDKTTARDEIRGALSRLGVDVDDHVVDVLARDADFIRVNRGPKEAAREAVGAAEDRVSRSLAYRESKSRASVGAAAGTLDDPRLIQATAFSRRVGLRGLLKYTLEALGVPASDADTLADECERRISAQSER
jgi:hypothetical protein